MNKSNYDEEECEKMIKKLGISSDYLVIRTVKGSNICIDSAYFSKLKQEINPPPDRSLAPKDHRAEWARIAGEDAIPPQEEGKILIFDYAIKQSEENRIIVRTKEMIQTYIYPNCFSWLTKALSDLPFYGEISCCKK